jgi:putative phosphoesterase
MKIVVMSDTHLYELTDEFKSICSSYCDDSDLVIHLGDWVSASVLNYLEQYNLEGVAGNMDNHVIHERLPVKKVISVGGFRIGITHGWGAPSDLQGRLYGEFSNVDAILFGHTHLALQVEEKSIFWFNPGSVFMGRGSISRSLGILHIDERITGEIVQL